MNSWPKAGEPLKVVHVVPGLSTGGAESFLLRLIQAHRGGDVLSAVVSLGRGGGMTALFKEGGIEVIELGLSSYAEWLRIPEALGRARGVLAKWQPGVIQGWMNHGNVGAIALRQMWCKQARLIWSIRQTLSDIRQEKPGTRAMIRLQSVLSGYPDAIVCNSSAGLADYVRLGLRRQRASIVPNGFDTEMLRPRPEVRGRARALMGIDDSAFVIGLVGRLHPMKDHETFFRAVEIAARSAEDLMAVCVGGGDDRYRKSLEKAITDLGIERICKLVGEQRDVHQLYAAFDVVCLTSACGEGFPNVIGEAMASGIPCVVTHVGECEQIVGNTGYVTPIREPPAVASAILQLRSIGGDARKELGVRARERIISNYGIRGVAERYLELYREVMQRSAKARV